MRIYDIVSKLTYYLYRLIRLKNLTAVGVVVMLLSSGCERGNRYQYYEGMVWNTVYHITYDGPSALGDSVLSVLDSVGKSLSVFDASSLVSRVNSDSATRIDMRFAEVYRMSRCVNEESGGQFDPTLSPLITAWGFGKGHKATGDTARIDSIMKFVGIEKTLLSEDVLIKDDRRIQFNFSAIAKGYGCDAIARMLRRNGVTNYLIEIGGELAFGGKSPSGGAWRVSVDKPIESDDGNIHESEVVIEVSDGGMATSGNYRNYHDFGGVRVGHTIDRSSGRPAHTDVASATVVCGSGMEADAYATALMAMGSEKGKELVRKKGLAVMLILHNGTIWMSPEFKKYVRE